MDEFSNYGLAHEPKTKISKQTDEFSSNTVWLITRKTQISEEFLDDSPFFST